ncbi:nitrilase-related carbon-nitrogen hydrolase [Anaeromicrobium sediminis]|uniref:Nitrilase n=1 Tax=Anaeromicrobium sediminis TaxID=1478221 RepID=A0A267ML00_9FIRM|nr:nitrilase-related carbon-nitrogen hydrolase [Anaeromicrobium sediminis]PAB60097.1 nitrilase [Anaeromicrobium sediminis]
MGRDRKIKIAVVQMKSEQGNTKINLERGVAFIEDAAKNGADIVCLPELFYSGYHLESNELQKLAEPIDGPMVQTLREVAKRTGVYIIAGYAESVAILGRMYNSAVFISDKGETIGNMRKVNAWGQEKLKFREGKEFPVYDTPLGKIGIMICYDVEFPEPSRIMALKGAEIVFVPAVWSIPAEDRWHIDLSGNALFNLFFMVGANPVGDGSCGCSKVVHPSGKVLSQASNEDEEILYCNIDLDDVVKERSRLPYLNDFKEDTFSMDAVNKY